MPVGQRTSVPLVESYGGFGRLRFEILDAPLDMTMNDRSGTLYWTPPVSVAGTSHEVTVAGWAGSASDISSFRVTVPAQRDLETRFVDGVTTVTDAASSLTGMEIGADADGCRLSRVSLKAVPDVSLDVLDERVAKASDVFALNTALEGETAISLPADSLPAGIPLAEVSLHRYGYSTHDPENRWRSASGPPSVRVEDSGTWLDFRFRRIGGGMYLFGATPDGLIYRYLDR